MGLYLCCHGLLQQQLDHGGDRDAALSPLTV
jgi:hypothetical protein